MIMLTVVIACLAVGFTLLLIELGLALMGYQPVSARIAGYQADAYMTYTPNDGCRYDYDVMMVRCDPNFRLPTVEPTRRS